MRRWLGFPSPSQRTTLAPFLWLGALIRLGRASNQRLAGIFKEKNPFTFTAHKLSTKMGLISPARHIPDWKMKCQVCWTLEWQHRHAKWSDYMTHREIPRVHLDQWASKSVSHSPLYRTICWAPHRDLVAGLTLMVEGTVSGIVVCRRPIQKIRQKSNRSFGLSLKLNNEHPDHCFRCVQAAWLCAAFHLLLSKNTIEKQNRKRKTANE